jgi:hypothetical protein
MGRGVLFWVRKPSGAKSRIPDRSMNEQKILRWMTNHGIADFETVADVERQQKKFLRNLEASYIHPGCYDGLESCSTTICGHDECVEVCRFASYRVKHIVRAHKLLMQCGEPIFEIRVARGVWVRNIGHLREVSVGAVKQLNRRALDSLHYSDLVAIGAVKVGPASVEATELWVAEIHALVTWGEIDTLKAAFRPLDFPPAGLPEYPDVIWAKQVENVGQALSEIFDYRLRPWRDPRKRNVFWPAKMTMALWEEYYRWRFDLTPNTCLIRYGCDRYWNKLEKEPRLIEAKQSKTHPYPVWLERYFFGSSWWETRAMIPEQFRVVRPKRRRASDIDARYGLFQSRK